MSQASRASHSYRLAGGIRHCKGCQHHQHRRPCKLASRPGGIPWVFSDSKELSLVIFKQYNEKRDIQKKNDSSKSILIKVTMFYENKSKLKT